VRQDLGLWQNVKASPKMRQKMMAERTTNPSKYTVRDRRPCGPWSGEQQAENTSEEKAVTQEEYRLHTAVGVHIPAENEFEKSAELRNRKSIMFNPPIHGRKDGQTGNHEASEPKSKVDGSGVP
jgi:hypothetical protein